MKIALQVVRLQKNSGNCVSYSIQSPLFSDAECGPRGLTEEEWLVEVFFSYKPLFYVLS